MHTPPMTRNGGGNVRILSSGSTEEICRDRRRQPELADKFFSYYDSVFQEGALSGREKALIALAGALQHGSDLDQMTEAIHVACAIRGGASLVHGVQMLEHVKKTGM